ncbi:MAG: hypothetical protein QOJ98_670, partial [Acidobacteriota bacterium]|nr:hypothetical protein [Acidobacteriota bacterium]
QVSVHHVHDLRANLVPDGSKVVVSASNAATWSGSWWVSSPGGTITDGTNSPTGAGLKSFNLVNNDARATYSIVGLTRVVNTGEVATPVIQVAAADPSGTRLDANAIALGYVNILGPYHSLGSSTESHLHGDGALYTTNVQFKDILDVNGNPLPEGSKVVVSANNSAAWYGTWWLASIGGQILNGTDSPTGAGFKTFQITNGTVDVVYGNQGITSVPGEVKTANVALMQAGANGERLSATALGVVPVYTIGTTSAQASADPSVFFSDGADYRSTITITNIKDSLGRPVPEGTLVGITAVNQATWAGTWWAQSAGGQILGGTVSPNNANFRIFPVTNGQVVVEYSSSGVIVSQGEKVATVQVASANRQGNILSVTALATVPIRLLSPASARVIAEPIHVTAFAPEVSSQITVMDIKSPDGVRLPDGSKIGLSARNQASWWGTWWADSAGGTITPAGTTAGDGSPTANNGNFQTYTIAGGQVKAQWDGASFVAGVGQTLVARVQVVPMDRNNNVLNTNAIGVAEIHVHGVTSTVPSGPASVKRGGSTGTTATITFSNIKDSAGNPVPDGTPVAVTALNNVTYTSWWNDSAGGTITNGNTSPDNRFKWFTVTNGAVTVEYSSTGAATSPAFARVSIVPANRSGAPLGTNTLSGGLWTLQLQ